MMTKAQAERHRDVLSELDQSAAGLDRVGRLAVVVEFLMRDPTVTLEDVDMLSSHLVKQLVARRRLSS